MYSSPFSYIVLTFVLFYKVSMINSPVNLWDAQVKPDKHTGLVSFGHRIDLG